MVRKIVLQLALYPGIGSVVVAHLVRMVGYEQLSILRNLTANEMMSRLGLSQRKAQMIVAALCQEALFNEHESWCYSNNVSCVLINDGMYPALLKHIGAPPAVLWVKGALPPADMVACALVGSRDANSYGKRVVQLLVPELVAHGVVTVSGGAIGIDGWVHEQTIVAGGKTIAVMGCGFKYSYPAQNYELFNQIVSSGGALVSPFAPDVQPSKGSFPARNRIIAGIAPVCVVVQAAEKSGALITAHQSLEENREVAAVPGPIDDRLSAGCNQLLAAGARVVLSAGTLLELCGVSMHSAKQTQAHTEENAEQLIVLQYLDSPATVDDLLELYSGTFLELQEHLFALQLAGKITKNHAGMWVRCG